MRTSTLSAAFVPYLPRIPLMQTARQPPARPPAGAYRLRTVRPLAGLGASGGSLAVGAASGAAAGAAAGPIGAAVGAIIGIAKGLLTKNYLNVAQMNAAEAQEVSAFNQYRQVAGQVAGRDIGYPALNTVFNGAVHSNIFPINNQKQCFHEGCSTYPGNASWSDQAMNGGSSDKNTMPDVVPQAIAAGVLDPRQILTQFWIPAQQAKGNHWAVPSNSIGQQVLVDIIDAYVADHVPNAPYFYARPTNTALPPVVNAPVLPPVSGSQQYAIPAGYYDTGQTTSAGHTILTNGTGAYFDYNRSTGQMSAMAAPTGGAVSASGAVPTGYTDTGQRAPNGLELYQGPDGSFYTFDGRTLAFYMTSGGSTVPPGQQPAPVYSPTASVDPNTTAMINQLIQQGQSQQAAYNAAMQQLAAQGMAPTSQLQQQVGQQVAAAAGIMPSGNIGMYVAGGAIILGLLLFWPHPGVSMGKRA